ncbi:DDB1- and CUL4-associated factor 4 [Willisornis vidua]|uniref:DDB1- and CUL4-associated factor 4 n=1 Tax=Willisornis vidua TaxID=1566151 RepID=A0ABQ9D249_9PASS|nr:DDB1- and CUL4-associated factor 4 [Willisornis vidua]
MRTASGAGTGRRHGAGTARLEREEAQTPVTAGPSTSGDPSSSSSVQNSVVPELPGFYYDSEKNRYFRLLPGHNNYNPLTKDSIQYKALECKRLRLLEEEEKQMKLFIEAPHVSGIYSCLLAVVDQRRVGMCSIDILKILMLVHELKVNCMQRRKIEIHSPDSSVAGTNNFKIIVADVACERIFTVNDVEHGGCKYGIINLSGLGKESLTVEMYDNLYFTNRKEIDLECCAVSRYRLPGLTRRVLVTNVVTGHRQTFGTSSDVLAQQFATQTPLLYNGCRSGEIFSIDVRQRNRKGQSWKATRLFHGSAVTSIHLMEAEHYLMAADMAGKIKLWDLRTTKCVKQYKGHHNEYAILPVHVNEEEGLLTAVGQDCYTRIWSLQDAHLLRTIPSPHPSSKDAIPSVVFSSRLGGSRGVPGLLMAVKQDLYHFSYI